MNCSLVPNVSHPDLIIFQRVAYTPVLIFGLILNAKALWHFIRTPQWTDTHIYMLNLLLADLLLTLFLPFRIFETYCPMEPTRLCTFLICVHYSNMYVSIFTITAISIQRYVGIRFPMQNKPSGTSATRRKKITSGICAFIWLVVIILCLIFHENMSPDKLQTCYERIGRCRLSGLFMLVLEIVGFLLPIVTIITCSSQTIWIVRKSLMNIREHTEEETVNRRKRVVAIVTANMIVFIVCFTPIHVGYLLRYIYASETTTTTINFIHGFYDVSEWLATTNCCLDSVGYYFLLKKVFRDKR